MISADVKANEKKQEVKDLVASSYKCLQEIQYLLKYNVKKACILFNFGWYSIHLDITC